MWQGGRWSGPLALRSTDKGEMRGEEPTENRLKRLSGGHAKLCPGGACVQECVGQKMEHAKDFSHLFYSFAGVC